MLLANRHKRTHPALTPASEDWYSIYPGGMEGWVDLECRGGLQFSKEEAVKILAIVHYGLTGRNAELWQ